MKHKVVASMLAIVMVVTSCQGMSLLSVNASAQTTMEISPETAISNEGEKTVLSTSVEGELCYSGQPGEAIVLKPELESLLENHSVEDLSFSWEGRCRTQQSQGEKVIDEEVAACKDATYELSLATYGYYTCSVLDNTGACLAQYYFELEIESPMDIFAKTGTEKSVTYGGSTGLSVMNASSYGDWTCQWFKTVVDDQGDERLVNLNKNGMDLQVTNVTKNETYWFKAYDSYGNVLSIEFNVTVESPIWIEAVGDSEQDVKKGEDVTLQVVAGNANGKIAGYRWAIVDDGDVIEQLESKESTCTITNIQKNTDVQVTAYDDAGNCQFFTFDVNVTGALTVVPYSCDSFLVEPGVKVPFKVMASSQDSDKLTYKWYQVYLNGEKKELEAQTDTFYSTGLEDGSFFYRCVVSDEVGNSEQVDFECAVRNDVSLENMFTVYVPMGQSAVISPKVTLNSELPEGYPELTYRWYKAYADSDDELYYDEDDCIEDVTGPSITIDSVTQKQYYCLRVSEASGSTNQYYCVEPIEGVSVSDRENNIMAPKGENVSLKAQIYGPAGTTVIGKWECRNMTNGQWESFGEESTVTMDEEGQGVAELTYTMENNAQFRCIVMDENRTVEYGTATCNLKLDTGLKRAYKTKCFVANPGDEIVLKAEASVDEGHSLKYLWMDEDEGIFVSTEKEYVYTAGTGQQRSFVCIITDDAGNTVREYARILEQGKLNWKEFVNSAYLVDGFIDEITLKTSATEIGSKITYEWYAVEFDGDYKEISSTKLGEGKSFKLSKEGNYKVVAHTEDQSIDFYFDIGKKQVAAMPEDGKADVKLTERKATIAFVPNQTTKYVLESKGNVGMTGYLYDANGKTIKTDASGAEDATNFSIACVLEKGKKYLLGVSAMEECDAVQIVVSGGTLANTGLQTQKDEEPKGDNPSVETPKDEEPKGDNPSVEKPKDDNPKGDNPKDDGSQEENKKPITITKETTAQDGNKVTTEKSGEAAITEVKSSSKSTYSLKKMTVVNGVTYKVTTLKSKAFKNLKKAKTVVLPDTIKTVKKGAFDSSQVKTVKFTVKKGAKLSVASKAFSKSKVKNVTITVSKNATSKEIKKLQDVMKKAGISKKNVKVVKSKKVLK